MLNKKFLYTQLKEIYLEYKNSIFGIHVGGSFNLGYIQHYHDIDIIVLYKDSLARNRYKEEIKNKIKNIDLESNINIISVLWITYKNKFLENNLISYAYMFTYNSVLSDNIDIQEAYNKINLLAEPYKKLYIKSLFITYNDIIFYKNTYNQYPKWLYHLYTGLCILKNNSYNLTDEQIQNINIIHDNNNQIKIDELFHECEKELNQWQIYQIS